MYICSLFLCLKVTLGQFYKIELQSFSSISAHIAQAKKKSETMIVHFFFFA